LATSGGGIADNVISNTTLSSLSKFYHLLVTFDNSSKICKLYIDGNNDITKTLNTTNWNIPNDIIHIGGRGDGKADIHNKGLVDQVRIFNKALTATEVNTLYAEV